MKRIEEMISDQQAEIRGLEDLVRRIMHKNRMRGAPAEQDSEPTSPESPKAPRMSVSHDSPSIDRPPRLSRLSAPFVRRRSR
jgi:hypothetical protein